MSNLSREGVGCLDRDDIFFSQNWVFVIICPVGLARVTALVKGAVYRAEMVVSTMSCIPNRLEGK